MTDQNGRTKLWDNTILQGVYRHCNKPTSVPTRETARTEKRSQTKEGNRICSEKHKRIPGVCRRGRGRTLWLWVLAAMCKLTTASEPPQGIVVTGMRQVPGWVRSDGVPIRKNPNPQRACQPTQTLFAGNSSM